MDDQDFHFDSDFSASKFFNRLRSQLSQVCDLFSAFGRHIAPAYHHDRCERSVQMRLYSMHKREFGLVFVAFFASLALACFIGLAGPPITVTSQQSVSQNGGYLNGSDKAAGPYVLNSPSMTTYHQQLWVIAQVITENKDEESFEKRFQVSVQVDGVDDDEQPVKVIAADRAHNRTRDLQCQSRNCSEILILHVGYFDYAHYALTVRFYGLESIHARYTIEDINFYFRSYNPSFTRLEIWFRFIFLILSICSAFYFYHCLRKYSLLHWSLEQRWMSILLPLLILYNDPLFPLSFLVDSWIPGSLDAMFQATFLSALLLFWLCVYHGLRQNERRFIIFYLPKLALVGAIWISMVVMGVWQKFSEMNDPTFSYRLDADNFYGFQIFFFCSAGAYLVYLFVLMIRAYSELHAMPFFDMRLKFMTLLVLLVLGVSVSVTLMRFGVGVLQDSFAAQLSTTYRNSAEFLSLYALLNLYVYTMAYVYSPTNTAVLEHHVMKDNPAFSMVNDSDEDVVFGSEDEAECKYYILKTSTGF
nr:EOG090X03I5 [Leptodora kindtii]